VQSLKKSINGPQPIAESAWRRLGPSRKIHNPQSQSAIDNLKIGNLQSEIRNRGRHKLTVQNVVLE